MFDLSWRVLVLEKFCLNTFYNRKSDNLIVHFDSFTGIVYFRFFQRK